jgi:hypothetical protein
MACQVKSVLWEFLVIDKLSLNQEICPTKRAPDWWESARFQTAFVAWSWFRQNGESCPTHQRVTQTVSQQVGLEIFSRAK